MSVLILEEELRIPDGVDRLDGFRRWAQSDRFPERGRVDFLAGEVEVEMSPEDLQTHGAVKAEIAQVLYRLVVGGDLGQVFIDRARLTAPAAGLSVEPDVLVVLWESLEAGRVRYVPSPSPAASPGVPARSTEVEGAADLVVEVLSTSSTTKDTTRLPPLYARAGIPELWLVDARGPELGFRICSLDGVDYRDVPADAEGWTPSPRLHRRFRLTREPGRLESWRYRLAAVDERL